MTKSPTDDLPGFVADEPEHCHDCYRLIRPGQRYFLTIEQAVVYPDCVRAVDAIRLKDGLTVEIGKDTRPVRHGGSEVEVFPHEVRHLVDALVKGAASLARMAAARGARI